MGEIKIRGTNLFKSEMYNEKKVRLIPFLQELPFSGVQLKIEQDEAIKSMGIVHRGFKTKEVFPNITS